jgi:hypothetical protein
MKSFRESERRECRFLKIADESDELSCSEKSEVRMKRGADGLK